MHECAGRLETEIASTEKVLIDKFGRVFDYLRISIIENCNFRCLYCMPEKGIQFKKKSKLLKTDEIIRIIHIAADFGVRKIRLTGGEPLLHPDLERIVKAAAEVEQLKSIHITTNGLLLHEKIAGLKKAGLSGLNISLDTFNEEKFKKIARRDGLKRILNNIYQALYLGFQNVKINVVMLRGFNDDELVDFVEFTRENDVTVRFIELMPFDSHQIWKTGHFVRVELLIDKLKTKHKDLLQTDGSSTEHHIFRLPGYRGQVAFIPSYSRSLCSGCTRIRLTADGRIRNCLYSNSEYNVLELIRNGASDNQIGIYIKNAMWQKLKDGWESQRKSEPNQRNSMTQIGG